MVLKDVTVKMNAPAPPSIVVRKGMSATAGVRLFGWGTLFGGISGFAAGFLIAQSIYSDERERQQVKRTIKITACACGGAAVLGIIGTLLASRR